MKFLVLWDSTINPNKKEVEEILEKTSTSFFKSQSYSYLTIDMVEASHYIPEGLAGYHRLYKGCLQAETVILLSSNSGSSLKKSPIIHTAIRILQALKKPFFLFHLY